MKSIDAIEKAKTYEYAISQGLTLEEKKRLFGENREAIMEWMIAFSKDGFSK